MFPHHAGSYNTPKSGGHPTPGSAGSTLQSPFRRSPSFASLPGGDAVAILATPVSKQHAKERLIRREEQKRNLEQQIAIATGEKTKVDNEINEIQRELANLQAEYSAARDPIAQYLQQANGALQKECDSVGVQKTQLFAEAHAEYQAKLADIEKRAEEERNNKLNEFVTAAPEVRRKEQESKDVEQKFQTSLESLHARLGPKLSQQAALLIKLEDLTFSLDTNMSLIEAIQKGHSAPSPRSEGLFIATAPLDDICSTIVRVTCVDDLPGRRACLAILSTLVKDQNIHKNAHMKARLEALTKQDYKDYGLEDEWEADPKKRKVRATKVSSGSVVYPSRIGLYFGLPKNYTGSDSDEDESG